MGMSRTVQDAQERRERRVTGKCGRRAREFWKERSVRPPRSSRRTTGRARFLPAKGERSARIMDRGAQPANFGENGEAAQGYLPLQGLQGRRDSAREFRTDRTASDAGTDAGSARTSAPGSAPGSARVNGQWSIVNSQ